MSRRARITEPEGVALLLETLAADTEQRQPFRRPAGWRALRRLLYLLAGLVLTCALALTLAIWQSRRLRERHEHALAVRSGTAAVTALTRHWDAFAASPVGASPNDAGVLAHLDSLLQEHPDADTLLALRRWAVVQSHVHRGLVALDRQQYHLAHYRGHPELMQIALHGPTYHAVLESLALLAELEAFRARYPEPVARAAAPPEPWEVVAAHAGGGRLANTLTREAPWLGILVPRLHGRARRALEDVLPQVEEWQVYFAQRDAT